MTPPAQKLTAAEKKKADAAQKLQDAETVKTALNLPDGATDEQRYGATLLRRAQDLRRQNDEIVKQRGSNRDMLRGMATAGHLNDSQKAAVEVFYPTPKPRADDPTPEAKPPAPDGGTPDGKSAK